MALYVDATFLRPVPPTQGRIVRSGPRTPPSPAAAVLDRAHDRDALRDTRAEPEVEAVIPTKQNRKEAVPHDPAQYRWWEKIARFFHRLTQFRGMVTLYVQLQRTLLALVHVAATWIMLKQLINMPNKNMMPFVQNPHSSQSGATWVY